MEIKTMEAAVEALLFAMGEAIPAADIAQVFRDERGGCAETGTANDGAL